MDSTQVNQQITDAVTQTSVQVVGLAPAMAMGSLYQNLANSVGMAAMNAVFAQHQAHMLHQASTAKGVAMLLSVDV